MPTAFDRLIPASDHDPLANLLDFGEIDHTVEQAGQFIRDFMTGLINGVVEVIKELTGLDLSALAGVLTGLDLSSPEAFLASLMGAVAQLPAVLTQLVTDIINMLITLPDELQTLVDPFIQMLITLPETLFTLVENVVTMLVGSPDTLQNLLNSLIGMLVTLPETLATLLISLVEQLTSPSGTDTLTSLMTSLIDMLVNAPETLTTLLEGLVTLLISLPTILVNLGEALMSSSLGMLGSGSLLDSSNLFGLIPGGLIPGLDASSIVSGSFAAPFLQPLIDSISTGMGGGLGLDFGGLQSMLDAIPGAGPIIDTFVNNFLNLGGSGFGLDDLARSIQSIPASLLTGSLPAGMLGNLNIGTLSSFIPEFLTNPNFDSPTSLIGQGLWTWDGTQGPAGLFTSVYTTAAGVVRELLSNTVAVAPGQSLSISGSTQWAGFTGAANSIMLTVAKFDPAGLILGYDTIGSIASPGISGGWTLLSGNYTVPAGVAGIQLRPLVTAAATAGKVWFGKLSVKQTATTLLGGLVPLLDASKIGSGQFAQSMVAGLATMFSGLVPTAPITGQLNLGNIADLQALNDNIVNYVFGGTLSGTDVADARSALNTHWSTTQSNAIALQAVQASLAPGVNVSYPFTNVPNNTQLPSDWVPTYSGPGTSTLGVKGNATGWYLNSDGSRICTTHHVTPTTSDTQTISTTVVSGGVINSYAALIGRVNAANTDYIICKIVPGSGFTFTAELGFVVAGVYTRWAGPTTIPTAAIAQLLCGTTAGGTRAYQFYVGSTKVIDYTEVGAASALDSSHRFCGIQGSTNGTAAPAAASNISFNG